MTNDKFRMTKETRNLKSEAATPRASTISRSLMLRHSFDIRHSDFVIFHGLRRVVWNLMLGISLALGVWALGFGLRQLTTD